MEQAKRQQWLMKSVWSFLLVAICVFFQANGVYANLGVENQTLLEENDLVQLRAGSHIMGFGPDKVYLVNTAGFLSVEFLNSHSVSPLVNAVETHKLADTVMNQGSNNDKIARLKQVKYPDIWDGISLRYDTVADGIAESSYFIQPGANVADIRLRYNSDTELQKDGSLKINLPTQKGYITESRPIAWQVIDGRKQPVQVAYEIQGQTIGFRTGAYSKNHELIIDPTYQWHSFYGSATSDDCEAIAVDGSGNVYMTGHSDAAWNGPGAVSPLHDYSGSNDIVVIKLNSSGVYQWHTFHGSSTGRDYSFGIALDSNDNVYVTGYSRSTWNGPDEQTPLNAYGTGDEIVVIKLNKAGAYQWHTFYGSTWNERGRSIAIDSLDNVYVTSNTYYTWDGPDEQDPVNPHSGGNDDIVILKLDSAGDYIWHTFHGAAGWLDIDRGIAIDSSDNVYMTGWSAASWDGPDSGSGPISPIHAYTGASSSEDIVIIKLNEDGVYQWHTFYGSPTLDNAYGIVLDVSDNVYVTGSSASTWNGPAGENPVNNSGHAVVIKLDSNGAYQWHTFHGSTDNSGSYGIAIDGNSNIYLTGESYAWNGPSGEEPQNAYSSGYSDIMVFKINSAGAYQWHTFYGAAGPSDRGNGIAVDSSSNVYVGGHSQASWNGLGTTAPLNPYNTGTADIVVFKLNGKSTLTIKTKGLGTVTSDPAGIDCGGDCTEIYDDGIDVSLTAVSAELDLNFNRWIIDCSETNTTTTVKINGDKSCTAIFSSFPWTMFLPNIISNSQR